MNTPWPLNVSNFTFLDKLKICKFFIQDNFWTMSNHVKLYEQTMADYVGTKYAVFVSSGSTANTLLAMRLKDICKEGTVVFPSTTWATSITPFIREGFHPHFIDVSKKDLSMDLDLLEEYLKITPDDVKCIFVTSLLGFAPDIKRLQNIETQYNVKVMLDNCESTLTSYDQKNISSYFTSTTSTYFGHQLQSVEGGFVFTNDSDEYEYYLMARNHGMVRSLPGNRIKYSNPDVDSRFDFNILGNNFRNSDINAFIGLLDFERVDEYTFNRVKLYSDFTNNNFNNVDVIKMRQDGVHGDVPFCLPLIFNSSVVMTEVLKKFKEKGVETRPIISGNILHQTCFKGYQSPSDFPVSNELHDRGLYIGLHNKLTSDDILDISIFTHKL